jgi:hypothetical protein
MLIIEDLASVQYLVPHLLCICKSVKNWWVPIAFF